MNNTWKYAARELGILMSNSPNDFIGDFIPEILALCEAFGKSKQSVCTAPYTANDISSKDFQEIVISFAKVLANTIERLCLHQPITPLTGDDDEWDDIEGNSFQNNRCSSVFKEKKSSKAYNLDAILWRKSNGVTFHGTVEGIKSTLFIKSFPFIPKTFVIDVFERDKGVYGVEDIGQLEPVFKYYGG